MENSFKRRMTEEEISAVVNSAFGGSRVATDVQELKDGWFNAAYAIRFDNGQKAVLKAAPSANSAMLRYEADMMEAEVSVLRLLKQAEGIPVPEVYFYSKDEALAGDTYFLMEYIPGEPYNKVKESYSETEREEVEEELGRINRRINEIKGERFGYYGREQRQGTSWPDVFNSMIGGLLADAGDAKIALPASAEQITAAVHGRRSALAEVTVPRLVHWDLWDGNLFVAGSRITGVIDCERALWGDPLMENYFRTGIDSSAFLRGYGLPAMTTPQKLRIELYDLYLALIMHIECTYRNYEDSDHREWAANNLSECWKRLKLSNE